MAAITSPGAPIISFVRLLWLLATGVPAGSALRGEASDPLLELQTQARIAYQLLDHAVTIQEREDLASQGAGLPGWHQRRFGRVGGVVEVVAADHAALRARAHAPGWSPLLAPATPALGAPLALVVELPADRPILGLA